MNTAHAAVITEITGGITAVPGMVAAGVHAGIKKRKPDLALVAAPRRSAAAAVYTRNAVQAAPLAVTRRHLADGHAQAVVVVSGIANTCTGEQGLRDAEAMAVHTGRALGIDPRDVIVASTGVIGSLLPMDRVEAGIRDAARRLDPEGGADAALAIMTTDTRPKEAACRVALPGSQPAAARAAEPAAAGSGLAEPPAGAAPGAARSGAPVVTIGGMAKGSGMIHPDMATMLAFLATDAAVAPGDLQRALREAVEATFNLITVDGDTSPNDMVAVLATGTAGGEPLTPGTAGWDAFTAGLTAVCDSLARQIVADGEGATRTFGVRVTGAASAGEARRAARAVAASSLVKTAVYGRDANWGRVLVAAGASGAAMNPDRASLDLEHGGVSIPLFRLGSPVPVDEEHASRLLGTDGVVFVLDLGTGGTAAATAWGCDLTEAYVEINAAYRT
ncbi:MAG TPA: bifunctional ornithine acetyltransferase/N-acetylglutamate synthase [Bacillota bacterium]